MASKQPVGIDVTLDKWNPTKKFRKGRHYSMMLIASRRCGKSYLLRYLMKYHLRSNYDIMVLFCNSHEDADKYIEIFPTELFFPTYKPEVVQRLIEKNKEREKKGLKKCNFLVVIDDNVSNSVKNDETLKELYCTGRHNGITVVFISQQLTLAHTSWRSNSDFTFILKQNSSYQRELVRDYCLRGLVDFGDQMLTKAQEKRSIDLMIKRYLSAAGNCVVIDQSTDNDVVQFFRAPEGLERIKKIKKIDDSFSSSEE